jgi:hypothetical protein
MESIFYLNGSTNDVFRDITQGLQKVEQIFEARSIDSLSPNLERRIEVKNVS